MIVFEVDTGISKRVLKNVTSWEEVPKALHEEGIVNMGKVHVYKLEYKLLCTTPQIVDTTYKQLRKEQSNANI